MRWLIAGVIALTLAAGGARAQSLTANACLRFDAPWAKVSGGTDLHRMQAEIDEISPLCPLKKKAEQHLVEVRRRLARANATTGGDDHPAGSAGQPLDQTNAEEEEPPPLPNPPPTITAGPPPDPCSPEAIDLQDPSLPPGGPDPASPPRNRAVEAGRYLARARAFKAIAMRCGANLTAPLQNDTYAVELDPKNPAVLKARAEAYIDTGNFQAAIDDFSSAIAARGDVDPDQDMLLLYADRAFAYSKLGRHNEEITDLEKVVDRMRYLNADVRGDLKDPTVYKLRLARALTDTGDFDGAEGEYAIVDQAALDWRDRYTIGSIEAQKSEWEKAIADLTAALTKLATEASGAEQIQYRPVIEVALGKAYAARGGTGDPRAAWDAFTAALADAPDNADAQAGRMALTPPLAPPTFDEPALESPSMPAGVSDLDRIDQARPPHFCGARERNAYLDDSVTPLADTLNRNIEALGLYSDKQLVRWKQYDQNAMLTHTEKLKYEQIINDERARLSTRISRITKQHDAAVDFFNRVSTDASLIQVCKTAPGA